MVAERQPNQDRHDGEATLGDLLYGNNAKAPPSEQVWVGLVQSIAGGDQGALHTLYTQTHRIVFTLIMRITGNRETAEELTLDVFHDVWQRAPTYDPANGSVVGWIMNQARSRAIDRLLFEQRKKRSTITRPIRWQRLLRVVHKRHSLPESRAASCDMPCRCSRPKSEPRSKPPSSPS